MNKIISVTPIYNNAFYIRPHFSMLKKHVDEMIVLLGDKPFPEYKEAFGISDTPDASESILKTEFPEVSIYPQAGEYYGGVLLNDGLERVRAHGGDIMLKLDADMFLTDTDFAYLIETIRNTDFDSLVLNYPKNTFVYKGDLDHGVTCSIFPVGNDPIAISVNDSFIVDGRRVEGASSKRVQLEGDFMVHHLVGFFRTNEVELRRCEGLSGFTGWQSAPHEIKQMFV